MPEKPANLWQVLFHDEFLPEFRQFAEAVRKEIYASLEILSAFGPQLGRPLVDTLKGSKHSNMKELRVHAGGGAWRIAFAFDAKRRAILLVGGDKAGMSKDKFYRRLIEVADRRFSRHRDALEKEARR